MPTNSFIKIDYKPNDLVANKYRIIKKLGEGGMNSVVYLGEDISIKDTEYFSLKNKHVAIKVINRFEALSDDDWIKYHDECVTASRLTGKKNIVSTYDVISYNNDNTIVIIMEYVDGTSLRKYIDSSGSLNVNEAIYYFRLLLEAIRELHSFRGKIIHRDLKPENILLTKDLRNIKLIDFGISSVIETINDKAKEVYTNENVLYGTYPYICPDLLKLKSVPQNQRQEMAHKIITVQFDFFSLGVIFYEMLTGEKPFYADNYEDVNVIGLPLKYDIISMHDINPNIHIALENIIFRCLASKPEDLKYRYTSIDQIIGDLERYEKKPLSFVNAKLLKPKNRRVLPIKRTFNVDIQKTKEKFYVKKWFYWIIFCVAISIVILTIILLSLHLIK